MADLRAQWNEEAVGANHATKADVVNRLALAEHGNDGKHGAAAAASLKLAGLQGLSGAFRGLRLRTHPDADLAASRLRFDLDASIINGDLVEGFSNIVINKAVTGAINGWEAAPVNSTWNGVWAIYNGTTKAGFASRGKNYLEDQSFTTQDTNTALRSASAATKLAQGFQLTTPGSLPFAQIFVHLGGSPSGNMWLTVEGNNAGAPDGTPLATSDKMPVDNLATSDSWVLFVFRTPPTLSAATQYHLVLNADFAIHATNNMFWAGDSFKGYANGAGQKFDGTTWSDAGLDLNFKAYVTQNDNAPVFPSGYNGVQIGWVYMDSSGNLLPFVALDRFVRVLGSLNTGVFSATIPSLFDISALVPPVPLKLHLGAENNALDQWTAAAGVPDGFSLTINQPGAGASQAVMRGTTGAPDSGLRPIYTEFQRLYGRVGGGTGRLHLEGWEW